MKVLFRSAIAGSLAAYLSVGIATALMAAELTAAGTAPSVTPPAADTNASIAQPAQSCLNDLTAFDSQLQKDGYWLGGSGYGYGYAMGSYGDGYPIKDVTAADGYQSARPGYEVRMLIASANILARHGQQQQCEDVLASTRVVYKQYQADMISGHVPFADVPGWRRQQIALAQPVTGGTKAFRSDELIGTDVRDPQNQVLGSVDDLVMSPTTGKIAFLVIARGGIFGFGEKYVPVPWEDFKIAPNGYLLVLGTTLAIIDGAPRVSHDQFSVAGHYDEQSQKVQAYWLAHQTADVATPSKG